MIIDDALHDDDLQLQFVELKEHPVHRVPTLYYRMVAAHGEAAGRINLRTETTRHIERYAGHIGYEVYPEFRGHHFAARAVKLLVPVARELGIEPLWITCDPENIASRRTCELAGAAYVETVNVMHHDAIFLAGHPRKCRYRLYTAKDETEAQPVPSEEL